VLAAAGAVSGEGRDLNVSNSVAAPLTKEQVDRFEDLVDGAVESLMRPIAALPANPQGYAFFRQGDVRAHLSTNPYAR
jgi:hypothetical protein